MHLGSRCWDKKKNERGERKMRERETKKKTESCRQCFRKGHWCVASGHQCRNLDELLHNPMAGHEARRYAIIRKDDLRQFFAGLFECWFAHDAASSETLA